MNWANLIPWCLFAAFLTVCGMVYQAAKTSAAIRLSQAHSGGQAYVAGANAEAAERVAKANAYFAQVQSLESAWQSFLENRFAVSGDHKDTPKDLRTLRAAFENMYDFSNRVEL